MRKLVTDQKYGNIVTIRSNFGRQIGETVWRLEKVIWCMPLGE